MKCALCRVAVILTGLSLLGLYACECCLGDEIPGQCGLEGKCVECNRSSDCNGRGECSAQGECFDDARMECLDSYDCNSHYNHHLMYCTDNRRCALHCNTTMDCLYGSACKNGDCVQYWCPESGKCPQNWGSIKGSLECQYVRDCPEQGLYMGTGGLSSQCVECNFDGFCDEGICNLEGKCVLPECEEDTDCENDFLCRENRCESPCESSEECQEGEICEEESYCRTVRGISGGRCDVWGWRPIRGTLACYYDPCHDSATIPGVCALSYACVSCLTDDECPEDAYCSLWGSCYRRCGEVHGGACSLGRRCVDEKCELECESDRDCLYSAGECLPGGLCHIERCAPDGSCPEGWKPGNYQTATGSLACVKIR